MTTYTSKNGLISITDDVSGGYSNESRVPCNARERNKEFKLVLNDCLSMAKRIVELERRLNISECMVDNLRSVKAENQTDFNNYTQALEVNNLRQQAKGIEDFFAWLHITQKDSVFGCSRSDLAEHFAADLKKQADELAQGDIELVKKWLADNESVGQQELEDNRVANAANTAYADAVEAAADAVNADAYADVVNAANVAAYADAADAAANAVYWIKRYEELKEQE